MSDLKRKRDELDQYVDGRDIFYKDCGDICEAIENIIEPRRGDIDDLEKQWEQFHKKVEELVNEAYNRPNNKRGRQYSSMTGDGKVAFIMTHMYNISSKLNRVLFHELEKAL